MSAAEESTTLLDGHQETKKALYQDLGMAFIISLTLVTGKAASKDITFHNDFETIKYALWWRSLGTILIYLPTFSYMGTPLWPPLPQTRSDKVYSIALLLLEMFGYISLQLAIIHLDLSKAQTFENTDGLWATLLAVLFLKDHIGVVEAGICVAGSIFTILASEPFDLWRLDSESRRSIEIGMFGGVLTGLFFGLSHICKRLLVCRWYESLLPEVYFNIILLAALPLVSGSEGMWRNCSWSPTMILIIAALISIGHILTVEGFQSSHSLPMIAVTTCVLEIVLSTIMDWLFYRDQIVTTWVGYLMVAGSILAIVLLNLLKYHRVIT